MTHPKLQGEIAMFAALIRAIVAVTTTCLIIWGGNAHAEILITTAAISRGELTIVGRANNLQQSWRFDWEPPKAVLWDVRTIIWILGC
jgi:hypothetical protein